jgi:tetratricopeptide (TPR) repeat protein
MNAPTTSSRRVSRVPRLPRAVRLPVAVLGLTILVATGGRVVGTTTPAWTSDSAGGPASTIGDTAGGNDVLGATPAGMADLDRIRANVQFWSARSRANERDFVSSTRWAAAEIDLARATGDVTRYVAADEALNLALEANPDYRPAVGYRGAVLVALHEFSEATQDARSVLAGAPSDPVALATLGDASLALGDMDAARGAYQQLSLVVDSAAVRVRRSHLAFVDGDPAAAVEASHASVAAAVDEGLDGSALAWYRYQLGETLAATGDLDGAASAFDAAVRDDPSSGLAHWGLARIATAGEHWDEALNHLDAAIAVIPSPDYLARRADVYQLRGAPGDDRRERDDRRTVLAIGAIAGDAAGVYDRTLSLYLASRGEEPGRALALAMAELDARRDVYGYDALAWALLANGRAEEARAQMAEALALGTRDAKLLYHAGMIEARLGNDAAAREYLEDALATDPSFDPLAVREARATLEALS